MDSSGNMKDLQKKHTKLCTDLNLDLETSDLSWTNFMHIKPKIVLEGDPLHWLGCAVFEACRRTMTTTVSKNVVRGIPISLKCLLRCCNLSLYEFFVKIKQWADIVKLPENDEINIKVQKLEKAFYVGLRMMDKYSTMFAEVFLAPTEMEQTKHRNKKQKNVPCTSGDIFEITWLLYITFKEYTMSGNNDLVDSHALLPCCIDFMFKNVLCSNRQELLNPKFKGLPPNWSTNTFHQSKDLPCVIEHLNCAGPELTEAVYAKNYRLLPFIKEMYLIHSLKLEPESLTGLVELEHFEANREVLMKHYDQLILKEGSLDEKLFLAEYKRQLMLVCQNNSLNGSLSQLNHSAFDTPDFQFSHLNSSRVSKLLNTPLTSQKYLTQSGRNQFTSSSAKQSIENLLKDCKEEPSDNLNDIFNKCTNNPSENIEDVVNSLIIKFKENIINANDRNQEKCVKLSVTLFYKLLENILQVEQKQINKDFSHLLDKTIFFICLFASSVDIILHSYSEEFHLLYCSTNNEKRHSEKSCDKPFVWVLPTMGLTYYDYVRVIELIVRSTDQFSRETVKYLAYVEESILESFIWESKSPIWELFSRNEVPKFEDIALPGNMVYKNVENANFVSGPSATETFQSPVNPAVKKQLFFSVKPGQSVLQTNKNVQALLGTTEIKKDPQETVGVGKMIHSGSPDNKPKKTNSLCIILRKFYNLAGVRLHDLCNKLSITDFDLKSKIWTTFEASVRQSDLIKDRHLDQLLMCSAYLIFKMASMEFPRFIDMLTAYRRQPQSKSHIYRNVLIVKGEKTEDLIYFYNHNYLEAVKPYLRDKNVRDLPLSPLPSAKTLLESPRQQVMKNVYVTPLESPVNMKSGDKLTYLFNRSASENLKDINKAVAKRKTDFIEMDLPQRKKIKRMQVLLEERKSSAKES